MLIYGLSIRISPRGGGGVNYVYEYDLDKAMKIRTLGIKKGNIERHKKTGQKALFKSCCFGFIPKQKRNTSSISSHAIERHTS